MTVSIWWVIVAFYAGICACIFVICCCRNFKAGGHF